MGLWFLMEEAEFNLFLVGKEAERDVLIRARIGLADLGGRSGRRRFGKLDGKREYAFE